MLALNRLLTDDFDLQFTRSTKAKPIETIPDLSKLGGQMNGFFSSFEGGTICGSIRRALSKEYESQFDRIEIASATRNAHCDHLAKSITTTAVKVLNRLISLQGETTPEGLFARKLLGRTHFTLRDFYREIMLVLAADHSTWIELRNLIQLPRRDNGKNIRKTKWEGDFENRVRQILSNLPETGTSLGADAWLEHLDRKQLKECFKKEEAGFIRQDDKIAEAKSRELDEKRKRREARKKGEEIDEGPRFRRRSGACSGDGGYCPFRRHRSIVPSRMGGSIARQPGRKGYHPVVKHRRFQASESIFLSLSRRRRQGPLFESEDEEVVPKGKNESARKCFSLPTGSVTGLSERPRCQDGRKSPLTQRCAWHAASGHERDN